MMTAARIEQEGMLAALKYQALQSKTNINRATTNYDRLKQLCFRRSMTAI